MSPAAERPVPTKKSLRIWTRNYGQLKRTKQQITYRYPRTVEAAKDPSVSTTGTNKMFFMIAIDLHPDSKIIKPDDSDSDAEVGKTVDIDKNDEPSIQSTMVAQPSVLIRKPRRKYNKKRVRVTKTVIIPSQTMTDDDQGQGRLLDCEKISETDERLTLTTDENASQTGSFPPVIKAKRKYTYRKRKPGTKILKKNNENKTACSGGEGGEELGCNKESLPVTDYAPPTPPPSISPPNFNSNGGGMRKKTPPKKAQPIPKIVNSFRNIIKTCSETGLISFNMSKEPPQPPRVSVVD